MTDETLVKIENLSYRYNEELVLDHINLEIKTGDFLGVIGPNGSGKTTLLKLIIGLMAPTSGKVSLFGSNPREFKQRYKLGYVPQRAGLNVFNFPVTVSEIVGMGLVNVKNKSGDLVRDALNAVSMHKYRDRLIGELSGGQQQRVFIARALVGNPQLLILDEPTVGVDAESQESFYELLRHLNKDRNLTLILVSHDIDVISKEVSSIACLNKKLLGHISPHEFSSGNYVEKMYGANLQKIAHNH